MKDSDYSHCRTLRVRRTNIGEPSRIGRTQNYEIFTFQEVQ